MVSFLKDKKLVSIKELSQKLSVSEATLRNWIKLNKIRPNIINEGKIYFTQEYSDYKKEQLNSNKSTLLKSRRNKKYINGSFFYKDYISNSSKNTSVIEELLNYTSTVDITLSEQEIKYIIADCAIQLFLQNNNCNTNIKNNYLIEYIESKIQLGKYSKLIDDLIDDKYHAVEFINKYPYFFKNYIHENNEDILGLLYMSLSDINGKKSKGAYYTPTKTVKKIINRVDFDKIRTKKILDPCCGSGNFLLQLPGDCDIKGIYGYDIDDIAIFITRINMALKFKTKDLDILYKNFINKNFLLEKVNYKFDYIIGNPPWGADLNTNFYKTIQNEYQTAQNKNTESYNLFIEKSLECLKLNGNLLFVLPEAILTVKKHKVIRQIILSKNSIKYIEFLGNIFDKVLCPSIILQIQHTNKTLSTVGLTVKRNNKTYTIYTEREITPDVFNFNMNDKEYLLYKKILSNKNNLYLKNNAIFGLGIVTGDNKKYISNKKTNTNEIILKGTDIEKFKIKKSSNFITYTPNHFQQFAPISIYRSQEKLLYRFISKKLIFAYDNKQTLSLNSCNILIPQIDQLDIKYIMAILNSKIAQFIFEKKYNSLKVLKSHIEGIPIPYCDKNEQIEIINLVNKLLENKSTDQDNFYEELEQKISKLYDLTTEEYDLIKAY